MWISVPPRGVEPKSLALQRGFLTLDHQGGPWLDYCRREWQMLKSSGTGERGFYWERRTGAWKKQWRTGRAPIPPPGPVVWGSGRKHLTLFAAASLAPTMGAHKWESLNKYLLSDWVISSLCLGKRLSRKLIQVHCERWAGMGRGEVQRDLLRGHWMGQVGTEEGMTCEEAVGRVRGDHSEEDGQWPGDCGTPESGNTGQMSAGSLLGRSWAGACVSDGYSREDAEAQVRL